MNELTAGEVAEKVREHLRGVRPAGIALEVMEEKILKVDDWWRVPVRPSELPPRMFDYYEALADAESELQEKEQLNVLFATAEPAASPAG
jgi:hypothetical protein